MTDALLTLTSVTRRFGNTEAVDGVSLDVAQGEFVSLLGPSGCGKTTLLRLIAGFADPDSGEIRIGGRQMKGVPPARRNLGLVFQNYSLWPHMTVADNVAFGLDCRGIGRAERKSRVAECLALVQLDAMAGRFPRELSGGQQQRVALARALAYRPTLLLLDEPLSALDRKLREDLQGELRRLQRELGVTTILVTHDQDEAIALSDRIAVMNAGRIEHVGDPEEIYTRPATAFVAEFVGRASLLRGQISSEGDGSIFVAEDGMTLRLSSAPEKSGPVRLLLRPEMISIERVSDDDPGAVKVGEIVFAGAAHDVVLRLDSGARVVASVTDPATIAWLFPSCSVRVSVKGTPICFSP